MAGGKRKSPSTVTMARLWLSAGEGTLPVLQPLHPEVAGQQRSPGQPGGWFCSYLFSMLAAPAQPAPRSARALQCWAAQAPWQRHSSVPCSGTAQHVLPVCRAATGSAPCAHQDSDGCRAGGLGSIP